ncbi:MAG TPA: YbfB/YjiJ family MFS transporter [Pseudomonas sp.]|jgi:predicted MFS family arabinose efflux permease
MLTTTDSATHRRNNVWLHILAGLCASLVGVGLARFAYTPLIPSLIGAHWFCARDVIYLSAANLIGYLIGALAGRPIAARLTNGHSLRLMMLLATASFFACAWPLSITWFFAWRLLSGIAGGAIIVVVAATVIPHVPAARKGLASGAIFLGVGLGIAGSGTLVPLLLSLGLRDAWIGLGMVSLLLTAVSWFGWPTASATAAVNAAAVQVPSGKTAPMDSAVYLLFGQYALMAAGLVPAMVFLVDYVTRGQGASAHVGALIWVMYGIGAILGPVIYGLLADHLGARRSIRLVLLIQAIAVAGLCMTTSYLLLGLLAVIIGSFPPGIVPLALARIHELVPNHEQQQVAWSRATVSFATFQALAGYGYSVVFNSNGGHHVMLFAIAAGAITAALIADWGWALVSRTRVALDRTASVCADKR